MKWEIRFHRSVKEQILAMPPKVQARFIRLLELMEKHGPNLGAPHTNTSPHTVSYTHLTLPTILLV